MSLRLLPLLLIGLVSCFPSDEPPPGPPPPKNCGNAICDSDEDCQRCPSDCKCCAIVDADGIADNPQNAEGAPDGKTARLAQNSELQLVFGREVFDLEYASDFTIVGTVQSLSSTNPSEHCPGTSSVGGTGGFEVAVSSDGSDWKVVGVWSQSNNEFDVGCAQLKTIRWIRIKGQQEALGEVDAITAKPNSCIEESP